MRAALIQNDAVVNIIKVKALDDPKLVGMTVVPAEGARIGDHYDGVSFTPHVKTPEELAAEAIAEATALELKTVKLFFGLVKALLASNVLNVNDPNLAEIKAAYLKWKQLTGN